MESAILEIEEGKFILKNFAGHEYVIDIGRTQIVKALGEAGTVEFIKTLLDRSMSDALILSNLIPLHRKTAEKTAAARAKEEEAARIKEQETAAKREAGEPGGFANRKDREFHEEKKTRLGG